MPASALRFRPGLIREKKIPDLREHALFALRNLLHDNPENQAVVDTFRTNEQHVGPTVVVRDPDPHGAN